MDCPSEGRVHLGDADLWELDPQLVSAQVGYLPQNVHLFKGTLRSNLALSGAVSDSAMLETVRALGLDQVAAVSESRPAQCCARSPTRTAAPSG